MTTKQIIITIVLLIVCFPIGIGYGLYIIYQNKSRKEQEEYYHQMDMEINAKKQDFESWRESYIQQNGKPDREITPTLEKEDAIFAHQGSRQIFIKGKMYSFDDILSYGVEEITYSEDGTRVTKTKVNTKSMLGRAVVGGLVAGPLGAVVGGATASTTSTTTQEVGYSNSYYDILIKVRDIANPTIKISGFTKEEAQEIGGLLEAVIALKNN